MAAALYQRPSGRATTVVGRCLFCRYLSASASRPSGHNRWSKIKHDKEKADSRKHAQRNILSKELIEATKALGPNPADNPRLASAISVAKQAGYPKASIDAAIARGQGVSASGKPLEPVIIEAILPPSVAVVVDCQTDSKLRTLQEVRATVKYHEGTPSPVSYMFTKRGRILFERDERGRTADDVLDGALEAGAEDIETNEGGNIVVYTEPSQTMSVGSTMASSLGLKIHSSEILWFPSKETMVEADSEKTLSNLSAFIDDLQKESGVQNVFMNIAQGSVNDDVWTSFKQKLAL